MYKKRIVITGIGVVSPIGIGKDQFWSSLFEGKSGFRQISLFDTKDLKVNIGGQIDNFNPNEILNEKRLIDLDRATLLLLSAAKLGLDDAKLEIDDSNTFDVGICIGTTFGSLFSISRFNRESYVEGPRYVNPSIFPSTVGNSPASRISIMFKVKGFNTTISTGQCAGLDALDYARDFIELDKAGTIIAGSVEDLSIQVFLGLYKLKYLSGSKDNTRIISSPFDKRRNGIVLSEGASTLVLQSLDDAKKGKNHIYGEILGIGSCFDPSRFYKYNPKGYGMIQAMELALEDAKIEPDNIDCIFANANSTKEADSIETIAIKQAFGDYAYNVPVVAIKSMLGETFSAGGGLAVVAALGAIEQGIIPATTNYKEKDNSCDLDYVPNEPRKKELLKVMINAFGPNGANTSLIIGKYRQA